MDTETPQKVELPVVRAKDKKIVCLGPRTEENEGAYDITRSNLKRLIAYRNGQTAYAKGKSGGGGPDQNAHRISERLNTHTEVVILPNGGAGFIRNMKIPFPNGLLLEQQGWKFVSSKSK